MVTVTNKAVQYHVFTHNLDEWFSDYDEALVLYRTWAQDYGSARLYQEVYIDDELLAIIEQDVCECDE